MRTESHARGSVIDHVGISVPDVRAAVELIRELGGEIRTELQTGVTASLIAHVTDPWGGRFELLEDPVYTGINHIHLFASDADAMSEWFLQVFGGEYDEERGRGRFHTILYDNVWVHITQAADDDQRAPSRYRATDHIGFRLPILRRLPRYAEGLRLRALSRASESARGGLDVLRGAGGTSHRDDGTRASISPARQQPDGWATPTSARLRGVWLQRQWDCRKRRRNSRPHAENSHTGRTNRLISPIRTMDRCHRK